MIDRIRRFFDLRPVELARRALLPLALVAATITLALSYHPHYPLQHWLVWRYLGYWASCAGFTVACISSGHRALRALGRGDEGLRDELLLSFGVGVLVFFWSVFAIGLLGLLNRVTFFALPVALTLAGWKPALRFARRAARAARLGLVQRRPPRLVSRAFAACALAVGIGGIALVYAQILSPDNISFDARWYHLGLAEHYVAEGAVRRFPEGWYIGAYPQLASLLYTWAFLHPSGAVADRSLLAAHLEFTLFLWTLVGVAALARRLAPRAHPKFAWVCVFLFPGLFVYDSNLGCGAEHVLAFWAPLLFIALLRALAAPSPRTWLLVACFTAGACLTKYTAFVLVAFPLLALAARCAYELAASAARRRLDRPFWRAPFALAAGGLALTAPHWLKNWVWYGNPIYPMASRWFTNRPWSAEAELALTRVDLTAWAAKGTTAQKLRETLLALYNFSFVPHDFPRMHGVIPVFGSLFTVSIFALPFLRGTKRAWALTAASLMGVFTWYWTHHEDRYLQALVPWMAAVVAAVVALAWTSHVASKAAVAALVGLQLTWSADLPFYGAHAMTKDGSIEATLRLLRGGLRKEYAKRFEMSGDAGGISSGLPKDARILLHEYNPRLGFNRPIVTDVSFFQGGLHYAGLAGPKALYDALRGMGVTHVVVLRGRSRGTDSYAGDLLFFDFLSRHGKDARSSGGFEIRALSDAPDEDKNGSDVLYLGCPATYDQGLYARADLLAPGGKKARPKPRQALSDPDAAARLAKVARYVIVEPKCFSALPSSVNADFVKMASREEAQLWVRKPGGASAPTAPPSPPAATAPSDRDLPLDPHLAPDEKN